MMKSPRKYLNHFGIIGMEDLLSEMIKKVQKDAYNQAIEDAINAEWRQHNGIEFTDEEMRIKLKIK